MVTHKLKVWSEYMDDLISRKKSFEVRFNDRNFQLGDVLVLLEYDQKKNEYLDREFKVEVTYILDNSVFDAVKDGYVVMAIKPIVG